MRDEIVFSMERIVLELLLVLSIFGIIVVSVYGLYYIIFTGG